MINGRGGVARVPLNSSVKDTEGAYTMPELLGGTITTSQTSSLEPSTPNPVTDLRPSSTPCDSTLKQAFQQLYKNGTYTPINWKNAYNIAEIEILAELDLGCRQEELDALKSPSADIITNPTLERQYLYENSLKSARDEQNEFSKLLEMTYRHSGKFNGRDDEKADKYAVKAKLLSRDLFPDDASFESYLNSISLLDSFSWFSSFRLFLLRLNRVLPFLSLATAVGRFACAAINYGGLTYIADVLIVCYDVYQGMIVPDTEEEIAALPSYFFRKLHKLKQELLKGSRLHDLGNGIVWFTVNLVVILKTGGLYVLVNSILNLLGFKFDVLNELKLLVEDKWKYYKFNVKINDEVKRFKAKLDDINQQISTLISTSLNDNFDSTMQLEKLSKLEVQKQACERELKKLELIQSRAKEKSNLLIGKRWHVFLGVTAILIGMILICTGCLTMGTTSVAGSLVFYGGLTALLGGSVFSGFGRRVAIKAISLGKYLRNRWKKRKENLPEQLVALKEFSENDKPISSSTAKLKTLAKMPTLEEATPIPSSDAQTALIDISSLPLSDKKPTFDLPPDLFALAPASTPEPKQIANSTPEPQIIATFSRERLTEVPLHYNWSSSALASLAVSGHFDFTKGGLGLPLNPAPSPRKVRSYSSSSTSPFTSNSSTSFGSPTSRSSKSPVTNSLRAHSYTSSRTSLPTASDEPVYTNHQTLFRNRDDSINTRQEAVSFHTRRAEMHFPTSQDDDVLLSYRKRAISLTVPYQRSSLSPLFFSHARPTTPGLPFLPATLREDQTEAHFSPIGSPSII